MKAIIQTTLNQAQLTDIQEPRFSSISIKIKTKYVPLLRYELLKLDGSIPSKLPMIMGYGATGIVTKVGALRSNPLLNQRVLVLHPWGTFQEEIVSDIPLLTIPIIDGVSFTEATALIGGVDLALTLFKLIKQKEKQVIIYGADSVTGLVLMQLLTQYGNLNFTPKVRSVSLDYLNEKTKEYNIKPTFKTHSSNNLVIDLVGSAINQQLFRHISQGDEVISVAQKDTSGIHFISKPAFPKDYQFLMKAIKAKRLLISLNQIFSYQDFKAAINFQKNTPSRGRNLISFEN